MKILLREHIPSLRIRGDIVNVAKGSARNYLLPKGLALEANSANLKRLELEKRHIEAVNIKEKEKALALATEVEKESITIKAKAGEDEKLYGSVTNMDIAKALAEQGIEVDRRKIILEEPIKSLGMHTVDIKIHPEVTAKVKVWVVEE